MADRLIEAMTKSAARQYGTERVTDLAHALQCAELAAATGADEEMVLACLLHDVGRYAVAQNEIGDTLEQVAPRAGNVRDHHEAGADLIQPYVRERVTFLVRAHADAKRYLCATEPGYYDTLSKASKRTLTLQGGVMPADEAARVARQPWWPDALRLRRWDDQAKVGQAHAALACGAAAAKYFTAPRAASTRHVRHDLRCPHHSRPFADSGRSGPRARPSSRASAAAPTTTPGSASETSGRPAACSRPS
jgi:predicted HD phosphohydrolase